ncbi:glycosyl hydrolase 108 family protein [Mucilaginibacter sp. KACC 22773]|uniref:glycoside hydrolase family 108 protein n=1 Tax=Mucilaginibacter sp. KACC 22773 TaxID=3025671 RepID=UPI002366942B|nr:glycosyl hydrolase 108 family protein [Mucilaginibacter sp. KACC 22773]WDF77426.1 glycosyl hydrolase 108 family protein [Mucilaginibacter sp. KACC 22773]
MAAFEQAFKITMKNEGGYSNHPNDHGGETWRGVARHFWPEWPGWKIVDEIKSGNPASLNAALAADTSLEAHVLAFYRVNFWDTGSLDLINDQAVANQLFDAAVNMGAGTGAKFLQAGVNLLSPGTLAVDGKIGKLSIASANALNGEQLYNAICTIRKQRYEHLIAANPPQAEFRKSWFSRMPPYDQANS